jgi:hypothetical protein
LSSLIYLQAAENRKVEMPAANEPNDIALSNVLAPAGLSPDDRPRRSKWVRHAFLRGAPVPIRPFSD